MGIKKSGYKVWGGEERRDSVSVFLLLARESHNKTVNITI